MSVKKTLYRPAPELLDHSTTNLTQGSSSAARTMKIKQGVLASSTRPGPKGNRLKDTHLIKATPVQTVGPPAGSKRLTSTMKSVKRSTSDRRNPVVVCHDPRLVHSQIQSTANCENVAANTTSPPTVIIIKKDSSKDESMVKTVNKSSLNSSRCSSSSLGNVSSSLVVEKPQKTSTPSLKHRFDWSCNESVIAKHDTIQATGNEEQGIGNSQFMQPGRGDADDTEILYCRYLQAKHLELMAASNRKKKATQASSVLSFLHDKCSQSEQELAKLEDEVSELQHLYSLQCRLEQQKHSLAPSVDKLKHALEQYHVLCKNLDTTTHHMPLIDIQNPDAGEMEKALDESRILIGQMNILLKSKMPQIHQASEAMKNLSLTCEQEAANLPQVQSCAVDMTSQVMELGSLIAQLNPSNNG